MLGSRGLRRPARGEGDYRFLTHRRRRGVPRARARASCRCRSARSSTSSSHREPTHERRDRSERSYDRAADELRPIDDRARLRAHRDRLGADHDAGETRVICTASRTEERCRAGWPAAGRGWVTAEYGMLPASTGDRKQRDVTTRAPRRAHGRDPAPDRPLAARRRSTSTRWASARSTLDCDVLTADGGTRCASITGAYVALALACERADRRAGSSQRTPLTGVGRRGLVRDRRRRAAARPRLLRGLDAPRSTPTSS